MSIQSYVEKFLSSIDTIFANEANNLVNEARQQSGKEAYIAGKMDGLSLAAKEAKSVYVLFVKTEKEEESDKALY